MMTPRLVFISALFTLATTATSLGLESYYVVNPLPIRGVVEVEYTRARGTAAQPGLDEVRTSSNIADIFKLNYSRTLGDWSLAGGTSFQNRDISTDSNGQKNTVTGLSDITLSAKSGTVFNPMTLTYGGLINLSPGPAQLPYTAPGQAKIAGNNFSGIQSASPFIGAESYIDEIAVGGRLLANVYSTQKIDNGGDLNIIAADSATTYRLEGFAEFPVYQKVDVGLIAGVGRKDLAIDRYFEGGNDYTAQIYSQIKIEKGTSAIVSLSSLTQKLPIEKSSNEIAVGFRKSL